MQHDDGRETYGGSSMKTSSRVVVIGGGVVGVSTLYHLVKKGWADVVLIERRELTSGSTWHVAGLLPLFNMSYAVGQLHRYSVELYERLGAEVDKDVYNGAIAYTPDGNPIVGPAWDKRNFWLNEGHSCGMTAAGGAGWQLAEWIVEGRPSVDMLGVDPRRYGDYATKSYLKAKNEKAYADVFTIHYPDEERLAGRPLRTTPCYERMKARGAVFGQLFGRERPNWFAPEGVEQKDDWSFRRSAWFEHVGKKNLLDWRDRGFGNAFVPLAVSSHDEADAIGNNPIYLDGEVIGRATSGGYGFRLGASLALGYVRPDLANPGQELEIDILGQRYHAEVLEENAYDHDNEKLRA